MISSLTNFLNHPVHTYFCQYVAGSILSARFIAPGYIRTINRREYPKEDWETNSDRVGSLNGTGSGTTNFRHVGITVSKITLHIVRIDSLRVCLKFHRKKKQNTFC